MTSAMSRIGTCIFAFTVGVAPQAMRAAPQAASPGPLESAIVRAAKQADTWADAQRIAAAYAAAGATQAKLVIPYDKARTYARAPRPPRLELRDTADVIADYNKNVSKQ